MISAANDMLHMLHIITIHGFDLRVSSKSFMGQFLAQNRCWESRESNMVIRVVRPGDYCVDVGAHVGFFSCLMAKCGARVVAFEANPTVAELLKFNARPYSVTVVEAAASDEAGTATFYLPSVYDDGWGSLAAADSDNGSMLVSTVRMETVLQYMPRIRLMKIDIEGSELQALKGLGERVMDVDYFLIECTDVQKRLYYGSSAQAVGDYLMARGFRAWYAEQDDWRSVSSVVSASSNYLFTHPSISELPSEVGR